MQSPHLARPAAPPRRSCSLRRAARPRLAAARPASPSGCTSTPASGARPRQPASRRRGRGGWDGELERVVQCWCFHPGAWHLSAPTCSCRPAGGAGGGVPSREWQRVVQLLRALCDAHCGVRHGTRCVPALRDVGATHFDPDARVACRSLQACERGRDCLSVRLLLHDGNHHHLQAGMRATHVVSVVGSQ